MMLNLLIDGLPDTVNIRGTEYPINTDFRASILFELMVQDRSVKARDRILAAIDLYFDSYPEGERLEDVLDAVLWFYSCGKRTSMKDEEQTENETDDPPNQVAYSFEYDADYIFAAFLQQYGINLNRVKHLHWWEFKAMFTGLTQDCEFVKIMGYRVTKITKDMSKTEKVFLRKMKSVHALPISEEEQKEQAALEHALMNGGDLTKLLGGSDEEKKDAG